MMVKSTAVSDAGLSKQTIYEAGRETMNRQTYDRAIESMDDVNREIERSGSSGMGEACDMKGRDALRELLGAGKPEAVADTSTKRSSGAVKAMNLGLQRLSDEAAAAKSLRATLAAAEQVVELNTADVDDSFIVDRISFELILDSRV